MPGAELIEAAVQDTGYDRRLMRERVTWLGRLMYRFGRHREKHLQRLMHVGLPVYRLSLMMDVLERTLGKPVDQTLGPAVAQIQVVARKHFAPN